MKLQKIKRLIVRKTVAIKLSPLRPYIPLYIKKVLYSSISLERARSYHQHFLHPFFILRAAYSMTIKIECLENEKFYTYILRARSFDPAWIVAFPWLRSLCETIPINFIQALFSRFPWPPMEPPLREDSKDKKTWQWTKEACKHYLATSSWWRTFYGFPLTDSKISINF